MPCSARNLVLCLVFQAFLLNTSRHVCNRQWLEQNLRAALDRPQTVYRDEEVYQVDKRAKDPWLSKKAKQQGVFRNAWKQWGQARDAQAKDGDGVGLTVKLSSELARDLLAFVLSLGLHLRPTQPSQAGAQAGLLQQATQQDTRILRSTQTVAEGSFTLQMRALTKAITACHESSEESHKARWLGPLSNAQYLARCRRVRHIVLFSRSTCVSVV